MLKNNSLQKEIPKVASDTNGLADSVGHWSFRLHNKAKHCTGTAKERNGC